MPLQATSGAASYDGFGGGAAVVPAYIEEIFSTWLYTGNGSTQTITNGIDLSTKGGLVWIKSRAAGNHFLYDTTRGVNNYLKSNSTDAQVTTANSLTAFNTTGFSIGDPLFNDNAVNYVSWTFREQPKFFDVVTYTGTGSGTQTIAHNLGSVPGCIIVKSTSQSSSNWRVYHRSLGVDSFALLNLTNAALGYNGGFSDITSTSFGVADSNNGNGATFVAYLFAHDAGGFGLTGTDNVISCGSFTTDGSGYATVNLGYEPQWVLTKATSATSNWRLTDTMRGYLGGVIPTSNQVLYPDTSGAETTTTAYNGTINATGFVPKMDVSTTFIYIAIRRGPMKVPTLGTSVFSPIAYTGNSTTNTTVQNLTTNFAGDAVIIPQRTGGNNPLFFDKLRGGTKAIYTSLTLAEETITAGESVGFNNTQTVLTGQYTAQGNYNYSGDTFVSYNFRRAPGFFDEVCYTGTGTAGQTYTHNLGVVPELMIVKGRSIAEEWNVYYGVNTTYLKLNRTDVPQTATTRWNDTSPTSSVFSVGTSNWVNGSGSTYVAYLFATLAGVSKVFSYTGNGSSQTINCGFTGGARFVLIKRTDSTGDWYVWDSARGIVAGNDPHLSLNTTAAEVTTDDSVDTDNTGFIVNQVAATNVNVSSATYIGLAVA